MSLRLPVVDQHLFLSRSSDLSHCWQLGPSSSSSSFSSSSSSSSSSIHALCLRDNSCWWTWKGEEKEYSKKELPCPLQDSFFVFFPFLNKSEEARQLTPPPTLPTTTFLLLFLFSFSSSSFTTWVEWGVLFSFFFFLPPFLHTIFLLQLACWHHAPFVERAGG